MGNFISDIYSYGWAVGGYWLVIMAWVAFMMGDLANWGGFRTRLDQLLPVGRRRPFEIALMIAIIFFAGFEAWQDECAQYQRAASQRDSAIQWLGTWKQRAVDSKGEIYGAGGYKDQIQTLQAQLAIAQGKPPQVIERYMPAPPVKIEVEPAGSQDHRHLTAIQKEKLTKALKAIADDIPLIYATSEQTPGENQYFNDFVECFVAAKINWMGPVLTSADPGDHGVMIGVADTKNPPKPAVLLFNAIKSADIPVSWDKFQMVGGSPPPVQWDLFIGPPD